MKALNKFYCDQDYQDGIYDEKTGKERQRPLSQEESDYLTQFNRENYAGFGLKEEGTIHPQEYHQGLMYEANVRRRDLANQCNEVSISLPLDEDEAQFVLHQKRRPTFQDREFQPKPVKRFTKKEIEALRPGSQPVTEADALLYKRRAM